MMEKVQVIPLMKHLDCKYLRMVHGDVLKGDSDALANLFALTCQKEYQDAYVVLKDEYLTQDALILIYRRIAKEKPAGKTDMLTWMKEVNSAVCQQILAHHPERYQDEERHVLNIETGEQLLDSVLESLDMPQKLMPLDDYLEYGSSRHYSYVVRHALLAVVMILCVLLPFLLIRPKITVLTANAADLSPEADMTYQSYEVRAECLLPIRDVKVYTDNKEIYVKDLGQDRYLVSPNREGQMVIQVTSINGKTTTSQIEIE